MSLSDMLKIPLSKNPEKRKYEQDIKAIAWKIVTGVITHRLSVKDVDKLEQAYNSYYEKYPDKDNEKHSKDRIKKLREFIKK